MYQVGDRVLYGIHGICRIVEQEEQTVDRKRVTYLVLEPEGQSGARYLVPTHNQTAMAKLRPVLSREALETLITSGAVHENGWVQDENQRKQLYRELISSGDRQKLLQQVCTLYRHKTAQAAAGRKVHLCDENFLRDAERLLCSEIASVLELDFEKAREYLRNQLKG